MQFPIPSNYNRFTITVGLKAHRDTTLVIVCYDPTHRNTHYCRRKAHLAKGEQRTLSIPLPVTPKKLVLAIYDKNTKQSEHLDIMGVDVIPMESPKLWVGDAQRRYVDFAIQFAQKAGHTPLGFYDSKNHEFLIQYLNAITDQYGNERVTPARIHRQMPKVQISKRLFTSFSIPVRVSILLHEGCHWFLNTRDQNTADMCGLRQYLDYGFSKVEAVYALTQIFNAYPQYVGEAQVQRVQKVMNFIDQYTT